MQSKAAAAPEGKATTPNEGKKKGPIPATAPETATAVAASHSAAQGTDANKPAAKNPGAAPKIKLNIKPLKAQTPPPVSAFLTFFLPIIAAIDQAPKILCMTKSRHI